MIFFHLSLLWSTALVLAFNERIVFSEIQYNPPIGNDYEYLEVRFSFLAAEF